MLPTNHLTCLCKSIILIKPYEESFKELTGGFARAPRKLLKSNSNYKIIQMQNINLNRKSFRSYLKTQN